MQAPVAKTRGKSTLLIVFYAVVCFLLIETALQVRSHLRYGQSVFNLAIEETRYISHPDTGLTILRPSQSFSGNQVSITTNSLGLRSPEISLEKPNDSLRIAILGASTVMGAYAATNNNTFPAYLQIMLQEKYPVHNIEVINAGIAGYSIRNQTQMFKHVVQPLKPDLVIIYPGFNDIAGYCRSAGQENERAVILEGLPEVGMPEWLLSIELLKKNTVSLRTTAVSGEGNVDPETLDLSNYTLKFQEMFTSISESGIPAIVSTNTRAYRPDQPMDLQLRLSETARYYNSCFEISDLHRLYDLHNNVIADVAGSFGVPVLRLDDLIPGGSRYFVDASHFSELGERAVATAIFEFLQSNQIDGLPF